jgi:hypothetical protein
LERKVFEPTSLSEARLTPRLPKIVAWPTGTYPVA